MIISIAMATYNGAPYLREQLDSFIHQTRRPDELIVCDDGSMDETLAIVTDFARVAPFAVRSERNPERLGYSRNFEKALSLTIGDLIFISDQDDVWYRKRIEQVCSILETEPHVLATVNDQLIVNADGESSGETMFGNARRAGLPDTYLVAGSCTAIARPFLRFLLPFPEGMPYDAWIGLVADALAAKRLIDEPLQTFRRHSDNTTQPLAISSPNQWAHVRKYGLPDPRPGWTIQARCRRELVARLEAQRTEIEPHVAAGAVERAIASNERRIAALGQRLDLLKMPRWRRGRAILRAWRAGIYKEFQGGASVVRDLIQT